MNGRVIWLDVVLFNLGMFLLAMYMHDLGGRVLLYFAIMCLVLFVKSGVKR